MDPVITLRNVSKKFRLYTRPIDRLKESLHPFRKRFHHEHWALKEITFSVGRGETVGIMGRNGAGKSTLLQMITSVLEPSEGEVHVQGRVSALLELGAGFNPEMTGRENVLAQAILMGMTRREMTSKLPEIEAFADIGEYIDQPVKSYSSGMFVRLAFAMFISVEPDILIIDEALAVGDAAFQEKCFKKLKDFKERGKTFILVSHSAALIAQLCDRVLVIENGSIYFLGETPDGLIQYGQLMFGTQLPDESVASLSRTINKKTVLPVIDSSSLSNGWHNENGTDLFCLRPGYNKNERRSGNQAGQIIDGRIYAGREEVHNAQLPFAEDISLFVKVLYRADINRPRLAISLNTPAGLLVSGVNTDMKAIEVPPAKHGATAIYCFTFKNILAKGEYLVSLWLMSEEMARTYRLDTRESVLILESSGSSGFNGLVNLDVRFSQCEVSND
jgi:lipopolysaccharide transport system ATP-binding protein